MKNREWGWILFSITFLAMSTVHTAAATEVEIKADQQTSKVKVVSGFDQFLREPRQGQEFRKPTIHGNSIGIFNRLDPIQNLSTDINFLKQTLDAIKAALGVPVPDESVPLP